MSEKTVASGEQRVASNGAQSRNSPLVTQNSSRLSPGLAKDYAELLEHLSDLVLEFIAKGNVQGVRRWASSLAYVGFVLLDDRAQRAPSRGPRAA